MSVLKKTGSHYKLRKSYQQLNNNNVQSMATTQYPKVTVKSQATNVSGDLTWTPQCTHAHQFLSYQCILSDTWLLSLLFFTSDGHLLKLLSLHYQFQIQRIWERKSSLSSKEMHKQQERVQYQRKNTQRTSLNHPRVLVNPLMRKIALTAMVAVPSTSSMILMMIRTTSRVRSSSH